MQLYTREYENDLGCIIDQTVGECEGQEATLRGKGGRLIVIAAVSGSQSEKKKVTRKISRK